MTSFLQYGALPAWLDSRPLVLVTADHGEEFWDHAEIQSEWRDDPRGFWGVGHGQTLFEEILAIPLIAVGGGFAADSESRCPASLLDLAPTLFAAAHLDPAPGWRGIDLAARHPREVAALRRELDRQLSATAAVTGEPMQIDDALRRELEALGYL